LKTVEEEDDQFGVCQWDKWNLNPYRRYHVCEIM